MAQHLVQLWLRWDGDPSELDWEAFLPKDALVGNLTVKTFPWIDVEHEITWWNNRPLSRKEWGDLVEAESEVLARIVGDSQFQGMAGPIPLEMETDDCPGDIEGSSDD